MSTSWGGIEVQKRPLRVFIGFDPRERDAYRVAEHSIRRHASVPIKVQPILQTALRRAGLYYRTRDSHGRDWVDHKPFSTEFSFSRFLVPALAQYRGWALFCDCDFLWRTNIAELFALADDRRAVMCVKHEFTPAAGLKMDGQIQEPYPRKNWSSLILWNCGHPAHQNLMVDHVSLKPGSWLHGFGWLQDDDIGAIDERWNYLIGHSSRAKMPDPWAVHFTEGTPDMPGHSNDEFADEWRAELERAAAEPLDF